MPDISPEARQLHERSFVADFHAHPANKTYLLKKKLDKRHRSGGAFNPLTMRVDLPRMGEGGVDAVVSAIYLPERDLLSDCFPLRVVRFFAPRRWKRLLEGDRFERTVELIKHFEDVVASSKPVGGRRIEIAKSRAELEAVTARGNIALVHAVEGGHSLEMDASNVEKLFDLGVCMLTLAHFYFNEVAYPVDGVPANMKILGCFRKEKDLTKGLTPLGRDVVEEMVRLGMLTDMTHCTPPARKEVLETVNGRAPVVMTHVGVNALKNEPMNPSNEEIELIANTGGVIGVIAYNAWLTDSNEKNGVQFVVRTLQHIRDHGGIEATAFGSDFDGFTDPPDDLADHSMLPNITDALLKAGFSAADVEKVLGGNVRRVIEQGWGR